MQTRQTTIDEALAETQRLFRLGHDHLASGMTQQIIHHKPDHPGAQAAHGVVTMRLGLPEVAQRHLTKSLDSGMLQDELRTLVVSNLATSMVMQDQPDDAITLLDSHTDLVSPTVSGVRAEALAAAGKPDDARAALDGAPAPEKPGADADLASARARVTIFLDDDPGPALDAIAAAMTSPGLDARRLKDMLRLRGDILDAMGDHEGAFADYRRAAGFAQPDDSGSVLAPIAGQIIKAWTRDAMAKVKANTSQTCAPVFIVGAPMAGAPLAERLLVASGGFVPTGNSMALQVGVRRRVKTEPNWPTAAIDAPSRLNQKFLIEVAEEYPQYAAAALEGRGLARPEFSAESRPIDTLPYNLYLVGLAALCFPDATFVRVTRDQQDTAMDLYRERTAVRYPFGSDLEAIAQYALIEDRLAAHWAATLDEGRMISIGYDALRSDPSSLCSALGLPAPTEPVETTPDRTIHTVSEDRYSGRPSRWMPGAAQGYERYLGALSPTP